MEIRWVIRPGWDGPEKVLQVRYMHDTTIRAGMHSSEQIAATANYQWSEWKDVPEVDLMRNNK